MLISIFFSSNRKLHPKNILILATIPEFNNYRVNLPTLIM